LSFSLDEPPSGMTVHSSGLIRWTPAQDQVGTQPVTVIVDDGHGGQASATFALSVVSDAQNSAPQITSSPRERIGLGATYFYAVRAEDADDDALPLTLESSPSGMTLVDRVIAWQPSPDQLGAHTVKLRVEDGRGGAAIQQFTISVDSQNANKPPRILSSPVFT